MRLRSPSMLPVAAVFCVFATLPLQARSENAPGTYLAQLLPIKTLHVTNRSGRTISQVHLSPSILSMWGPDVLDGVPLADGKDLKIPLAATVCEWDIRIDYADKVIEERRDINVCAPDGSKITLTEPAMPGATHDRTDDTGRTDPSFKIDNRTNQPVTSIMVSPHEAQDWSGNILDRPSIAAGAAQDIHLPQSNCSWDILVVLKNDVLLTRLELNTCANPTLVLGTAHPAPTVPQVPKRHPEMDSEPGGDEIDL